MLVSNPAAVLLSRSTNPESGSSSRCLLLQRSAGRSTPANDAVALRRSLPLMPEATPTLALDRRPQCCRSLTDHVPWREASRAQRRRCGGTTTLRHLCRRWETCVYAPSRRFDRRDQFACPVHKTLRTAVRLLPDSARRRPSFPAAESQPVFSSLIQADWSPADRLLF